MRQAPRVAKFIHRLKAVILAALLLMLSSAVCRAQMYGGVSAGMQIKPKALAGELQIGYSCQTWLIQTGYHAPLNNRSPVYISIKGGKMFWINDDMGISVTGGFVYQLKSTDRPTGNRWTSTASIEFNKRYYTGFWFAQITQFGTSATFAMIGLKYLFPKSKKKRDYFYR